MIRTRSSFSALLAVLVAGGCRAAPRDASLATAPPPAAARSDSAAIAKARADSAVRPYTEADIRFMSRMIGHHAQAITISRLAPSNGASASIRTLAERIITAQQDEIVVMRQWLGDRRQPVPEVVEASDPAHAHHVAPMPGMLTPEQVRRLEDARGAVFDKLFLELMIQHHRGAMAMVNELFASYGAAQDQTVFKVASDIHVDQSTEVARMSKMLADLIVVRPPG
jgi:uncharacterized protein (DUF305 family)